MRRVLLPLALCMLLLTGCALHVNKDGIRFGYKEPPAELKVSDFVDGNRYGLEELLILENGSYVPYLVITNDYGGNSLLLRKNRTEEDHVYHPESIFGAGSAYYPQSSVDAWLRTEFPQRLTTGLLEQIPETAIEVYDRSIVLGYEGGTETISRQFFLLSATEHGLNRNPYPDEGKTIRALEHHQAPALEWLRSAYLLQPDVHAWAISVNSVGYECVKAELPIRPAFTLSGDLSVEALEDGGYRIVCDTESAANTT